MKTFDPGQMTTIVANVGIIASILFLAVELRQNNEFAAAEARQNRSRAGLFSHGLHRMVR